VASQHCEIFAALRIAYCLLLIAHCPLPSRFMASLHSGIFAALRIAYCLLPIAYCPLLIAPCSLLFALCSLLFAPFSLPLYKLFKMKPISLLFSALLLTLQSFAQTWTWDREPVAGQNVMIQIDKVPLEEAPLHVVAYFFDGTELQSIDAGTFPTDRPEWLSVSVAIHDHVSWMRVVVKNQYNQVITGDQKVVTNASALPKAALVQQALGEAFYGRYLGIDPDNEAILSLFREATTAYPQWLNEAEVYRAYYYTAKRADATEDLAKLKTHIVSLDAKPNGTSEAMMVNAVRAAKDMGDSTLQVSLRKKLDKKYPKSALAQEDMLNTFNKAASLEEKIKVREKFKSQFPLNKDSKKFMDQMTGSIAQGYADKMDWANVKAYVDQMNDPMARASACNNYAWKLSGERIDAPAINLDVASSLSATSLSMLSVDNPIPPGLSRKEWANVMENSRGMYGDTYALILFKQGKYEEALSHQSFSVMNNKFEDGEMNERYAIYLEKAGRTEELVKFMDEMIVSGKATGKVKEMHKTYWTQTASKEKLYDQYMLQLEKQAQAKREEHIMTMWEDTDAPAFTLTDLAGQQVSLSDYKGKTVILDFWATWCGPCKASFPGMKMAIEQFASDNNVVFLFVNSWENPQDAQKRVSDFIQSNNYPFHVLMDGDNKVITDYKVNGIPTKFIIGPDQKIHFTAVGYSGNNEELVEEIKTMIDLIRRNAGMSKS
jgi:thiol-disulfide isomerase/thioredoxin